jgi:hypothetical protein
MEILAISIPWRSDLLGRMILFSTMSFAIALGFYYAWIFLLSAVRPNKNEADVMQRFVRAQLGWLEKIPSGLKLLVPAVVAGLCWIGFVQLLGELELLPLPKSTETLWGQAGAIALASVLAWEWLLPVLFLLHLLNIYVYLGTHPAWAYISEVSRRLLAPLSFLHFGKVDLAPVAGIAIVIVLGELVIRPLAADLFNRFIL